MTDWGTLLDWLASGPRENGTAALHATAEKIVATLRALGIDPAVLPYTAYPWRLRLAGVFVLLGTLLYGYFLHKRQGARALVVAIAMPLLLLAELDFNIPAFGWLGATQQTNIEAVFPAMRPDRHLVFTAHYDSKTDFLDHVERTPIQLAGLPIAALLVLAAFACRRKDRPWLRAPVVVCGTLYGLASFAAFTGGAFVRAQSHGAIDDGAACAVLLRLAERLHDVQPSHTSVSLVFLSGEEVGVQGSVAYAAQRFAAPPELPTSIINLEGLGLVSRLAVFGKETFATRSFTPDDHLYRFIDEIHRRLRGDTMWVSWYGAATDARSFLARGIPALTLFSDPPGHPLLRGMHSAFDTRSQVQPVALQDTANLLETVIRESDRLSEADQAGATGG